MPFDGTNFQPEQPHPERVSSEERIFRVLFIVIAVCLFVMPISAAAIGDIARFVRGF